MNKIKAYIDGRPYWLTVLSAKCAFKLINFRLFTTSVSTLQPTKDTKKGRVQTDGVEVAAGEDERPRGSTFPGDRTGMRLSAGGRISALGTSLLTMGLRCMSESGSKLKRDEHT